VESDTADAKQNANAGGANQETKSKQPLDAHSYRLLQVHSFSEGPIPSRPKLAAPDTSAVDPVFLQVPCPYLALFRSTSVTSLLPTFHIPRVWQQLLGVSSREDQQGRSAFGLCVA
jgi:hypothetical protein